MTVRGTIGATERTPSIRRGPDRYEGESTAGRIRRTAAAVGALFLLSNATFLLGAFAFVEPILGAPDYLTLASANRARMIVGALLELINGVAYLGIAVLVFPVLGQRFPSMALWYVGFRVIEFVMQTLSDLSPLTLLTLSEDFLGTGGMEGASFQAVGTLLQAQRYWAFQMVSITLALGALSLYTMLYRSKLIPRFISVWGLVGATTVLTTTMLDIFALSVGPALGLVLGLPMLANELFLGVWLIVKGFNPSSTPSPAAEEP